MQHFPRAGFVGTENSLAVAELRIGGNHVRHPQIGWIASSTGHERERIDDEKLNFGEPRQMTLVWAAITFQNTRE